MKLFGLIGIVAALAIAGGVGYYVAVNGAGGAEENNIAALTVKATEEASDQVDVMMGTFAKMNPVAQPAIAEEADAPPVVASDPIESEPVALDESEGGGAPAGDVVSTRAESAQEDAVAAALDMEMRGSEVQEAFALMQRYSEEGNTDNDAFVMAAKDLQASWEPLFRKAYVDYNEMNDRIALAKSTAGEYFAQQERLTKEINDHEFRMEMMEHDRREHEVFTNWSGKADELAAAAYEMMLDMEDVNVFIAKAQLSAHFVALQKSTSELPLSMEHLNGRLSEFRAATYDLTRSIESGPLDDGV